MSSTALRRLSPALVLAAVLAAPGSARAQAAGPPPPVTQSPEKEKPKTPEIPSGVEQRYAQDEVRTVGQLPGNIVRGAVGVWNGDNITPALLGAVASGAASYADHDVANGISSPNKIFGRFIETGAGPIISSSVVAALFASGRLDHRHKRWRAVTYDMLDASLVNLAYTEALKRAFGRERPNKVDNKSLPSGHASNAFALATCFERHYGWRVSLPAYLIASAVAASRLQRNAHWLSDVVGGATVGYVVGRSVARVNGRPLHPEEKAKNVQLSPLVGSGVRGLMVSVVF
jgi:hypothetical protein